MASVVTETTNEGAATFLLPYRVSVQIVGTAHLLFHRWSIDGVESKAKAAKGSNAKKKDDLESYVYRDADGTLAAPGEWFRQSTIAAAKYRQDPRSPRKSAMDLFKAGIVVISDMCSLGLKDWEFVDRRKVNVQRNGITRERPAMYQGWKCEALFQVLLPEYITPEMLNETIQMAGKVCGVGDNRPTFGRFQVVQFKVTE